MLKRLRNFFAHSSHPKVIEAREALYKQVFNESPQTYHSTDCVFPHVDVYHFSPVVNRPYHTLITGGMAHYRQAVNGPTAPLRLELLMHTGHFRYWEANLLKLLAEFPSQNKTYFTVYQTVPIGNRLTNTSQISAFLLTPETEIGGRLAFEIDSERVEYLLCVPITMSEHAFAREFGGEELYSRLKHANLLIHEDDERRSIVGT
jgi:hypothetical protein